MSKLIATLIVLGVVFVIGWNAGQSEAEAPIVRTEYVKSEPEVITKTETVEVQAEMPDSCMRVVTRVQDLMKTEAAMDRSASQLTEAAKDAHKFIVQEMQAETTEALQALIDNSDDLSMTSVDRAQQVVNLQTQLDACEIDLAYPSR